MRKPRADRCPKPWTAAIQTSLVFFALATTTPFAAAQSVPNTSWRMYQYFPSNNAVFDRPDWQVRWTTNIGVKTNGGLSIVGSTLYVESFDHKMYAVDATTGKIRWSRDLGATVMNTPIVADGMVFGGTGRGIIMGDEAGVGMIAGVPGGDDVYGLSESDGRVLWRLHTVGENMSSGVYAISRGRPALIFASGDQYLYAVDARSGRVLFKRKVKGADFMTSLALYDGLVYGASSYSWDYFYKGWLVGDSRIMTNVNHSWAFNPESGRLVWQSPVGQGTASPAFGDGMQFTEAIGEALPTPAKGASSDVNFMLSAQYDEVQGVDAKTGRLLWKWDSTAGPQDRIGSDVEVAAPLYDDGIVYAGLPLPREYGAFEAHSGALRWKIKTHGPVKMSAVEKAGLLYFGDTRGYLYVVNASRGTIQREIRFPHIFSFSPPVIVGGTLFIANSNQLFAIPLVEIANGMFKP